MPPDRTMSSKFNGHVMEYVVAPQVYNRRVQQLGGEKHETDVFASWNAPQLRRCTDIGPRGICVVKALGIEGVGAHVPAWC